MLGLPALKPRSSIFWTPVHKRSVLFLCHISSVAGHIDYIIIYYNKYIILLYYIIVYYSIFLYTIVYMLLARLRGSYLLHHQHLRLDTSLSMASILDAAENGL